MRYTNLVNISDVIGTEKGSSIGRSFQPDSFKICFLSLLLLKVKVITILSNNQSGTQLVFYPLYLQQNKRYTYISFF